MVSHILAPVPVLQILKAKPAAQNKIQLYTVIVTLSAMKSQFWWPNLFYKGYLSFFEDDNVTIALMLDKAQSTEKEDPLGRPNVLIDKTFET